MWLNQMQEAFVNGAVRKNATNTGHKAIGVIVHAADRIKPRDPKDNMQLSYRTAQKLKNEGVIG